MINYGDPNVSRAEALLRGVDDGFYTVPSEIVTARRAFRLIHATRTTKTTAYLAINLPGVQQLVVEDVLAKAQSGVLEDGWVQPIPETSAERLRLSDELTVLEQAEERAASALPGAVRQCADRVITEGLRPALDKVLSDLRALQRKVDLSTVPFGDEAALAKAGKAQREAHGRVGELTVAYSAIRAAQNSLRLIVGAPEPDAFGTYGEMSNPYEVWPQRGSWTQKGAPWEGTPGGKVVWIALNPKAKVWMPTAAECKAAYEARIDTNRWAAGKAEATEGVFVPSK